MNKKVFIICIILLLCTIASCSGNNTPIFNDTICQAPCWRGISMGESQEVALNIVEQMPDVNPDSITVDKNNRIPLMEQGINWRYKNSQDFGDIYLHEGKVTMIYFPIDSRLGLSDLFNKYGNPEFIYLEKVVLDGVYISIDMIYLKRGICITYEPTFLYDPKNIQIKSSSKAKEVYYADPSIPNWQLKVGCLRGLAEDEYEKNVQKWVGYGTYSFPQSAPNS
jgi:hypothetical protein